MDEERIKSTNELEFAIFCIENVAMRLNTPASEVYRAFTEKSNILRSYIVPEYERLHTQGRDYIVDELIEVMNEEGVEI